MRLFLKELQTPGLVRSMYVAVPESVPDKLCKSASITILREFSVKDSVHDIIETTGLDILVDEQKVILLFPNPIADRWNFRLEENLPKDAEYIIAINESLNSGFHTDGWRAIHDVHFLLGFGSGASMVNSLVAVYPRCPLAAAVCTVGGVMADEAIERAVNSPVPALIIDGDARAVDYYIKANKAEATEDKDLFVCRHNPMQKVRISDANKLTKNLCVIMWEEFFRRIRRTNTSPEGDVDRRIIPEECNFVRHINDSQLGDNGGLSHDWIEHVPDSVKDNTDKKVPLMIFSHGMSDNPLKAADMIKFHEIGEREGFITVYPFSSDRFKWNLNMSEDHYDDVAYYTALIDYLKKTYPVDETRIYLSGFSNGAGMAMVFALSHPELIAAICPVDSTFPYANMEFFHPGDRSGSFISEVLKPGEEPKKPFMPKENTEKNLGPLRKALERQKIKAYRMPVMYFYGTRESEYPIRSGCNQELQYNFWKEFNNIPVKKTVDAMEPDAVGVLGDDFNKLFPCAEHPEHKFTHHVFYSNDEDRKDYYNFILMRGKAHEVHPAEREIGWEYVSRFSRNPDGSLKERP